MRIDVRVNESFIRLQLDNKPHIIVARLLFMYLIVVYDVCTRRIQAVHNFLRQYLHWVQNSVFEGEVTSTKLKEIRETLPKLIDERDHILVYVLGSKHQIKDKISLGKSLEDFEVV